MLDPNQFDKFSDQDLATLKKLFGGDSKTLYALRNLLWQFDITDEERKLLELEANEYEVLKKALLPVNSPEVPMGWITNMYQSLKGIIQNSPLGPLIHIKANDILINYLKQQFTELVSGSPSKDRNRIILEDLPTEKGGTEEQRLVEMIAYHNISGYIEGRMAEFKSKANPAPELTPSELKAKAKKNDTR